MVACLSTKCIRYNIMLSRKVSFLYYSGSCLPMFYEYKGNSYCIIIIIIITDKLQRAISGYDVFPDILCYSYIFRIEHTPLFYMRPPQPILFHIRFPAKSYTPRLRCVKVVRRWWWVGGRRPSISRPVYFMHIYTNKRGR